VIYWISVWFMRALFAVVLDFRVSGLENVPRQGPVIFIVNHSCAIDGWLTVAAIRRKVFTWTMQRNFANPVIAWILSANEQMPVEPGGDNRATMERTERLLREGRYLALCPEGDPHPPLPIPPFKGGFLKMALKANALVVPIVIAGSEKILTEPWHPKTLSQHIPRPCRVDLAILPAMRFEDRPGDRAYFGDCLEKCRQRMSAKLEELLLTRRY